MSISVVIPSRRADNLLACIHYAWVHEPAAKVVVVDDGLPGDVQESLATCEKCRGRVRQLRIVSGAKPFIFARNINIGIRATDPDDALVLLNDDALLLTVGGLSRLVAFSRDSDNAITVPACNVTGQPLQHPGRSDGLTARFVSDAPFICVHIPRAVLNQVGFLDERYCLDYGVEDLDYCQAATRAGYKVAIVYDVMVDHGSLHSSFRGDPRQPKSFARNYALYKQKWGMA